MRSIGAETRPALASKARLRWDEREGKYLLLSPERGLLLNPSAAAIIKRLDGKHSLAAIVDALCAEFAGAERATVEREVHSLLNELFGRGLLEGVT